MKNNSNWIVAMVLLLFISYSCANKKHSAVQKLPRLDYRVIAGQEFFIDTEAESHIEKCVENDDVLWESVNEFRAFPAQENEVLSGRITRFPNLDQFMPPSDSTQTMKLFLYMCIYGQPMLAKINNSENEMTSDELLTLLTLAFDFEFTRDNLAQGLECGHMKLTFSKR